jgi:hypothetical protein
MSCAERGAALLEILVAVVIFAAAGLCLIEIALADLRGVAVAAAREAELAREERILIAHSLLTKDELDQRLGRRQVGEFVVNLQRPEPGLYRIAVGGIDSPQVEDLVTVVYGSGGRSGS